MLDDPGPEDYADITAGMFDLSLIRLPATTPAKRIGSLVVNPGGPGGSGVEFVRNGATISRRPSASGSTSWGSTRAA